MYCKMCGKQISDTACFCEHCGADHRPAATDYSPSCPSAEQPPVSNPQPEAPTTSSTPYLVCSILVTLFCCLPLGIPAIVFASKIDSCNTRSDFAGAAENARKAKNFMIWGAVISVVFTILYLVFFGLMFAGIGLDF